jgi:thiol reductant ABC exporter CydD subunit
VAAPIDRRLLRESRAARRGLLAAGGLGLLTGAAVLAQAALLADVIARVATTGAGLAQVRTPLLALTAVFVARALLAGAFELSGRLGAVGVMRELRERLVTHLLLGRAGRREGERTGELAAAAVQGVDALEALFAGYLPQLVLCAIVPVAVIGFAIPRDPIAAGILALTVPLLVLFMVLIGLGARTQARKRLHALSVLSAHFLDVVSGLVTLRAYRREHAQERTLADVGERYRRETMGTLRIAFLSAFVLELAAMIGTAIVAALIGIQLVGGHLGLRAGLTVLLLCPELYAPLRAVGQQFHAGADGAAASERILAVLAEPPAVGETSRPPIAQGRAGPDPHTAPVRLDGVRFSYPGRPAEVLSGASLQLDPGRTTALVGPSGAGKSTIAKLLLGLIVPDEGSVSCEGVDLRDVHPDRWRERVGWIPQHPTLFAGTVAENIALATPDASLAEIRRAARDAGAWEFICALPEGLETRVGEGGRALSAGQGQRVALARALLCDAGLLILDEPTAHLDPEAAGHAARALSDGRTVLLITHDPKVAARADRVVAIADGRCELVAPPAPLVAA